MALVKGQKLRTILLLVAAALLAAAAFLFFSADSGELSAVCEAVNAHGYSFVPDDWYAAGGQNDTTIAALTGEDMTEAVAASKAAGFPSDTEKFGEVVLLLGRAENGDVVTIYIVSGAIELCFLQTTDGEILPL